MSKIIVLEYLTLDGVMEAPEAWQFPYFSDDVAAFIKEQILALDALLLGRVTYEIFAAHWPNQTNNEFGVADKLNAMPKYVVSSTLEKAEWNNSTLIKRDVVDTVIKLKQQPGGDISLIGSANLAQSLMEADLIDEYQLQVYPIVLGKGLRLFKDGMDAMGMKLVEAITFKSGAISLVYKPDGKSAPN